MCTLAQNFIGDTFIHSFTHFHAILMQFFSHNCAILAIYVLISIFWATQSIYMNCKIHFKYFHTLFLTHLYTFIQLIKIFIQFCTEFGYISQFQQCIPKICTLAQKYFGDTFITHLHTFMQSKCNFDTFFHTIVLLKSFMT